MKNRLSLFTLLFTFVFSSSASAQQVISKLEIKAKEAYKVGPENRLLVDTLIMHDKATILFNQEIPAYIGANLAIIGKKCSFITKGQNALVRASGPTSLNGQDGGDIEIDMHFRKLGSLIVDARGGMGEKGDEGRGEVASVSRTDGDGVTKSISPMINGRAPGPGGNGGFGGNIHFTYSTSGFIPLFNQKRNTNSIILLNTGGKEGKAGINSRFQGKPGLDGEVTLINKNETGIVEL
jgi:hypothetical protein